MKILRSSLEVLPSLLKTHGRLIGVNIGETYIATSISDFDFKEAEPLGVFANTNPYQVGLLLKTMIEDYSPHACVIGLPINSDHSERVQVFVENLRKTNTLKDLNCVYWKFNYFNFSKKSVTELLKPMSLDKEVMSLTLRSFLQLEPSKDKFTAVDILQGYLNFVNDEE